MFGIGDCLHQRAIVRELMKTRDVWLETYYGAMYHDLIEQGLNVIIRSSPPPRIRCAPPARSAPPVPRGASRAKLDYFRPDILRVGSILAAQFVSLGMPLPDDPDFSLPVPQAWRARARALIGEWRPELPIMVYRPPVLNDIWKSTARAPDPEAYAALFKAIRDRFFVVSVTDLTHGNEYILGEPQDADVKLHRGELDFETLAALCAEAHLVFACAGFMPVLAQAVGTPLVIVYGGNEGFKTTQAPGAKHAPTLPIEPDNLCECHQVTHDCDKRISLEPATRRLRAFVDDWVTDYPARVLIFGTTYIDSPHRLRLVRHWIDLHTKLNPGCDFLIVDSASPIGFLGDDWRPWDGVRGDRSVLRFPDNVGHLSRGGRDGWGRAFCAGLDAAIADSYDYVVHIEGDSLFRLPVMPIIRNMQNARIVAASTPVKFGSNRVMAGWVETGLMFFATRYLKQINFADRYDWPSRKQTPSPEKIVYDLLRHDLRMMSWRARRADKQTITTANVLDLDWVTHCWDNDAVYDRVAEAHR